MNKQGIYENLKKLRLEGAMRKEAIPCLDNAPVDVSILQEWSAAIAISAPKFHGYTSPDLELLRSDKEPMPYGVFAVADIPENTLLMAARPVALTPSAARIAMSYYNSLEETTGFYRHPFVQSGGLNYDFRYYYSHPYNYAQSLNHSSKANVEVYCLAPAKKAGDEGLFVFYSSRPIAKGEELFEDYGPGSVERFPWLVRDDSSIEHEGSIEDAVKDRSSCRKRKEEMDVCPEQAFCLRDVTVPDGTVLEPGVSFVKTWRFRNDSEESWPAGARLIFVAEGGCKERLGAPDEVKIASSVAPGQECDVSVPLVAPMKHGRYVAYFRLIDSEGFAFGQRVFIDVNVSRAKKSADEEPLRTIHRLLEEAAAEDDERLEPPRKRQSRVVAVAPAGFEYSPVAVSLPSA